MEIQINRSVKMNQDPSENDIARHLDPEIVADALRWASALELFQSFLSEFLLFRRMGQISANQTQMDMDVECK